MSRPRTVAAAGFAAVAVVAIARHAAEQRSVARGGLAPAWPATTVVPRGRVGRLADHVARWDPPEPARGLPRLLARVWAAPVSLAGLAFALMSGARIRWDGDRRVVIATGARGLARVAGLDANALGHVIVSRRDQPSARLLTHELAHVRQAERLGPALLPVYVWWLARYGYRDHPLERAARRVTRSTLVPGTPPPAG